MAYCVECGVKLAPGTTRCPLCNRKVVAPPQIIGTKENELFPPDNEQPHNFPSPRLDKRRKGLIELASTFIGIAIVTLVISGIVLKDSFSPWFSIMCVALGSLYFYILLFGKPEYVRISTLFSANTFVILLAIDVFDGSLSWSPFAAAGVFLYYILAVFPFHRGKIAPLKKAVIMICAVIASLFVIDLFDGKGLYWFVPIGLPTVVTAIVCLGLLYLRFHFGNPSMGDLVLSLILCASITTVAGDFFSQRLIEHQNMLSWSKSVAIVSVLLLLFLIASATVRKVRFYFTNKVH
ncbi:MAG: hypothetical protein PQJ47_08420 [Sphaerochaetaceae bacterium]|nr:hypothetical protein [Sphaerochaetaceae bacterium]